MSHVRYERDGDVAEIVLDSPPLNLFGTDLMRELREAFDRAAADAPRALIVRAEGRVVSGGVNVGEVFAGMDEIAADALTTELLAQSHAIEELPFPTLFVAHGLCLTAALEIALACDMLWAAEGAQFGLVERVVGITPLMGGTQRMAERAGSARAKEFVMTGGLYTAETLHEWGVVNRVLSPDELLESARTFAAQLASGPTRAHAATKAIVHAARDEGVRGADARTAELTSHLFDTEDSRNAVKSFMEEGPGRAIFTGK
jgi:enoyl-CoA hydratase/carnithine racemase